MNLRKHKVSFEEAATAMSDPLAATGADPDHAVTEDRYITFGSQNEVGCSWLPTLRKKKGFES